MWAVLHLERQRSCAAMLLNKKTHVCHVVNEEGDAVCGASKRGLQRVTVLAAGDRLCAKCEKKQQASSSEPCTRSEGTSIVVFKAAVARFLGCLSEEVGGIMARKGLPAEGESRGNCATEKAKGRVVAMKRGDSVTALRITSEGVQRFCQTESVPDPQWENQMVDPLAEKLQKVFGA